MALAMPNVPTPEPPVRSECRARSPKPGRKSFESAYRVTDKVLGRGMNGEVKLAEHKTTGKKVAVKTYPLLEMGKKDIADLKDEVRSQASIRHPNVAQLEAVYQSSSHVHLLVEHLTGGDVYSHIMEAGCFDESQAASTLRQLLGAVAHLHEQGYVHRDIKLENMMYTDADRDAVKLIDFGFCTQWKEGDKPLMRRCGTDGYAAPELVRKHGYTSLADMWCVGVVAHAVLTGTMIGRNEDWTPVFSPSLAECSLEAQKFVKALLTVDPADRLTAQQALAHSWMTGHERRHGDRCSSTCSTAAGTDVECLASMDMDVGRVAQRQHSGDFSSLYPSEPWAPRREKKSIWSVLPTFRFGASRRVGAALAAVRTFRSKRASRVSFAEDL